MASSGDPRDNRPFVGMDGVPVRCQMESSFLSLMQTAGLKEWAAQQSELPHWQTGDASASSERSSSTASEGKSTRRPSSSRSNPKSSTAKPGGRSRKSKDLDDKVSRSGRSKQKDAGIEEDQDEDEEAKQYRRENFVPDYSGYNTMDVELNMIQQQLMMRPRQ